MRVNMKAKRKQKCFVLGILLLSHKRTLNKTLKRPFQNAILFRSLNRPIIISSNLIHVATKNILPK